jgi:hypothetical protein
MSWRWYAHRVEILGRLSVCWKVEELLIGPRVGAGETQFFFSQVHTIRSQAIQETWHSNNCHFLNTWTKRLTNTKTHFFFKFLISTFYFFCG